MLSLFSVESCDSNSVENNQLARGKQKVFMNSNILSAFSYFWYIERMAHYKFIDFQKFIVDDYIKSAHKLRYGF